MKHVINVHCGYFRHWSLSYVSILKHSQCCYITWNWLTYLRNVDWIFLYMTKKHTSFFTEVKIASDAYVPGMSLRQQLPSVSVPFFWPIWWCECVRNKYLLRLLASTLGLTSVHLEIIPSPHLEIILSPHLDRSHLHLT